MKKPAQASESDPVPLRERMERAGRNIARGTVPYGPKRSEPGMTVMVALAGDAAAAVRQLMADHNLSRSGAAHHLIRLGAGLAPLPPLDTL